jgi:hypothetical protein
MFQVKLWEVTSGPRTFAPVTHYFGSACQGTTCEYDYNDNGEPAEKLRGVLTPNHKWQGGIDQALLAGIHRVGRLPEAPHGRT